MIRMTAKKLPVTSYEIIGKLAQARALRHWNDREGVDSVVKQPEDFREEIEAEINAMSNVELIDLIDDNK